MANKCLEVDETVINKIKIQHIVSNSNKSLNQLGKEIGVSHTTLTRIVNGNQEDMKFSTACNLADALGVDINEFREDEEDES